MQDNEIKFLKWTYHGDENKDLLVMMGKTQMSYRELTDEEKEYLKQNAKRRKN